MDDTERLDGLVERAKLFICRLSFEDLIQLQPSTHDGPLLPSLPSVTYPRQQPPGGRPTNQRLFLWSTLTHHHHHHHHVCTCPIKKNASFASARCLMLRTGQIAALVLLLAFVAFVRHSPSITYTDTDTDVTTTASRMPPPLVFPAVGRHTATVIFIHGLGDTGHGWSDAVQLWRKGQRLNEIKFILPHAPHIPITMNSGYQMPGWFDIKSLQKGEDEDGSGILRSREYFHGLIQQEIKDGIPAERIVLGGFSQGGAMSIFAGLTAPFKIGGIVGLSSWLLLHQTFKGHIPEDNANKATPIFMGHGDKDPLVLYDLAKDSEKALKDMGYDITFKTYRGMAHSASLEELNDVEAFIGERLRPKGEAN